MKISDQYFLITKRLGFRRWREDDLPLALGLWGDYEVAKLIDTRGMFCNNACGKSKRMLFESKKI